MLASSKPFINSIEFTDTNIFPPKFIRTWLAYILLFTTKSHQKRKSYETTFWITQFQAYLNPAHLCTSSSPSSDCPSPSVFICLISNSQSYSLWSSTAEMPPSRSSNHALFYQHILISSRFLYICVFSFFISLQCTTIRQLSELFSWAKHVSRTFTQVLRFFRLTSSIFYLSPLGFLWGGWIKILKNTLSKPENLWNVCSGCFFLLSASRDPFLEDCSGTLQWIQYLQCTLSLVLWSWLYFLTPLAFDFY